MSTQTIGERVSGLWKGQTAEVSIATRAVVAGSSENIRRTVTKVERCHSDV